MFFVGVTLPSGTSLEETDRVIRQFEQQALSLPSSEVNAVLARTGFITKNNERAILGSNTGMLVLDLVEEKQRQRSVEEVIDDLRERCRQIAGPESVEYVKNDSGPPAATDVEV
jgi:HAE1 family hydrophobic/amphiphilic exporter-1